MPLNKDFQSAVRGFHYYKRYWSPRLEEELFCSHERDNAFDVFAIKITDQCGNIRGHLPQEIARITKFLLDRGAKLTLTLTSDRYRRSPLVQGGLEIPCLVKIVMINTNKNNKILDRYLELINTFYTEPTLPVVLGSILCDDLLMECSEPKQKKKCVAKNPSLSKKPKETKSMDIRKLFLKAGKKSQEKKSQNVENEESDVVTID